MSKQVSDCCGVEADKPQGIYFCPCCNRPCDGVERTEWLHQKIDSLQMELREVKAKVATLEGETRTMQKFIKSKEG